MSQPLPHLSESRRLVNRRYLKVDVIGGAEIYVAFRGRGFYFGWGSA